MLYNLFTTVSLVIVSSYMTSRWVDLFVDLGKDTVTLMRVLHIGGMGTTYSWSLNKEYSSFPTLTGDPPY